MGILTAGRVVVVRRCVLHACAAALVLVLGGCSAVPGLVTRYEYDETVDLSLDGSATVYINGSVPALIALHGLDLDPDPRARLDRETIRRLYAAPGVTVRKVSASRRNARRFIHLVLDVEDVRRLPDVKPLSWSVYQLDRANDEYIFAQTLEGSANRPVPDVEWTGQELVAFRVHLPSRVTFHNAGENNLKRGNILLWEGSFAARLDGAPARLEARMETQSILHHTLWIFVLTFTAATMTLSVIVWLVVRQGRKMARVADGPQHV